MNSFFYFLFFYIFCSFSYNNEVLRDQVEVVVGGNIVLKSDIDFELNFYKNQNNLSFEEEKTLRDELIKERIKNLVLVECAQKDTNIIVDYLMVEESLDRQIQQSVFQAGSEEILVNELGMSIQEIKNKYRPDMEKKILIEQYSLLLLSGVNITRKEVELFYNTNLNLFSSIPPSYDFSVIELSAELGPQKKNKIVGFLETLKDSINNKDDFVFFAKKYSEDPTAKTNGGFLGFTKKGTFVEAFEKTAYSLEIGEVGGPVETLFGIHLIYLDDRVGEKIKPYHILKRTTPGDEDYLLTSSVADSLVFLTKNDPGMFDSLAVNYKKRGSLNSGVYFDISLENIPQVFISSIQQKEEGEVFKIKTDSGFYLILINKKQSSFVPNLDNAWVQIKNMALAEKKQLFLNNWVLKKQDDINIKYFNNNY
ncbi:MAG: hypothetical protein CBD58_02550 [bacterium TMED198]|nr:MAG: hypothetical protein CBD58_02550 [bacterium TMED198]